MMITGHDFLKRHNWLVNRQKYLRGRILLENVGSPVCDLCQENTEDYPLDGRDPRPVQTIEHLFSDCEALALLRLRVFGTLYNVDTTTTKLQKAMDFLFMAGIELLPEDNQDVQEIDQSNPLHLIHNQTNPNRHYSTTIYVWYSLHVTSSADTLVQSHP